MIHVISSNRTIDKYDALRLLISKALSYQGFHVQRVRVCHSHIVHPIEWNSLKRDKSSVLDCFPLFFPLFPPFLFFFSFIFSPIHGSFSTQRCFPLASQYPSNIRRQIIAAINPRLIEPNAACRCLLLAKSISHYKSIGPFLSFSPRVCPYHLPIKLRHSLPFGRDDTRELDYIAPQLRPRTFPFFSFLFFPFPPRWTLARDRISQFTRGSFSRAAASCESIEGLQKKLKGKLCYDCKAIWRRMFLNRLGAF